MKIIATTVDDPQLWPKQVECPHCKVILEYEQNAVYLAREFELDSLGNLGFWIDCTNCEKSIGIRVAVLPKSFTEWLYKHPREHGEKDSVRIVGNNPLDTINTWPKILRCGNCTTGISLDITDIRALEDFGADGEYEGIGFYYKCPKCQHLEKLDAKKLPVDLTKELEKSVETEQKKTNRWKLLHRKRDAWEDEVKTKWETLSQDQIWIMAGDIFPVLDDRIAVAQTKTYAKLSEEQRNMLIGRLCKCPNVWPLI